MDSFLFRIAAGVLGEQPAKALPLPGINEAAWNLAQDLLRAAKLSKTVAFFLDDIVVMHYGSVLAASYSTVRSRATGERIRGVNEVVSATATLSAECLREMFAAIELLAFKLVHLKYEKQRPDYDRRSDGGHRRRIQRLTDSGLINSAISEMLRDLYLTRCQFSHTVQSLEHIAYRGVPLARSFGSRSSRRDDDVRYFFIDDMFVSSDALLSAFRPLQRQQLDAAIFESTWRTSVRDSSSQDEASATSVKSGDEEVV